MDEIFEYLLTAASHDPATGEAATSEGGSRAHEPTADTAGDEDVLDLLLERLRDDKVRREIIRILFRDEA